MDQSQRLAAEAGKATKMSDWLMWLGGGRIRRRKVAHDAFLSKEETHAIPDENKSGRNCSTLTTPAVARSILIAVSADTEFDRNR